MAENKGYAGKIKNVGAQFVQAVHPQQKQKDHANIQTGKDLRNKTGKKG